jgi:hypothetical protein
MITQDEIREKEKGKEFGIHVADVKRDYVRARESESR